jgi:hypothetical protein
MKRHKFAGLSVTIQPTLLARDAVIERRDPEPDGPSLFHPRSAPDVCDTHEYWLRIQLDGQLRPLRAARQISTSFLRRKRDSSLAQVHDAKLKLQHPQPVAEESASALAGRAIANEVMSFAMARSGELFSAQSQ